MPLNGTALGVANSERKSGRQHYNLDEDRR